MPIDGTPRILITGAGGPAAVSFTRAVEGQDLEIFAVDIDPNAAGLYLVDHAHRALVPLMMEPDGPHPFP